VGARAQVKIQVRPRLERQISNTVMVTSHSNDLNPQNNTAIAKTAIVALR